MMNSSPGLTMVSLAKMSAYLIFAALMANVPPDKQSKWGWTIFVCALFEAVILLVRYPVMLSNGGYLSGNPSYSALIISAGFLFGLSRLIFQKSSKLERLTLISGMIILGIGLYFCRSRSIAAGLFMALVLLMMNRKSRPYALTVLVLSTFGLLLFSTNLFDLLKMDSSRNVSSIFPFYFGRLVIWKTAIRALWENWIFGTGLGNFELAYLQNQLPSLDILRYSLTTKFAHNDFLQIMVETGVPGFLLLGWGFKRVYGSLPKIGSFNGVQLWALAVSILFIGASFFNFIFYLPVNGLIFSGCVGILIKSLRVKRRNLLKSGVFRQVSAGVMVLFCFYLLLFGLSEIVRNQKKPSLAVKILPMRSDLWYEDAMLNIQTGNWIQDGSVKNKIIRSLNKGIFWNSEDPFIWSRLARVLAFNSRENDSKALEAFHRSQALAPKHTPFYIFEGFYHLERKNPISAAEKFKIAVELEPRAPVPRYALGLAHFQLGNTIRGVGLFKVALELSQKYRGEKAKSEYARFLFSINEKEIIRVLKDTSGK